MKITWSREQSCYLDNEGNEVTVVDAKTEDLKLNYLTPVADLEGRFRTHDDEIVANIPDLIRLGIGKHSSHSLCRDSANNVGRGTPLYNDLMAAADRIEVLEKKILAYEKDMDYIRAIATYNTESS